MNRRHPVVQRLVERRKQLGWSQIDLADVTGKSVSAINHFENDPGGRRYDLVEEIADALGLRIDFTPVEVPAWLREAS